MPHRRIHWPILRGNLGIPPRKNENVQARVDWRANETLIRQEADGDSLGGGAPLGYGERRLGFQVITRHCACASSFAFEKCSRKC